MNRIVNVRSPVRLGDGRINCEVQFDGSEEWLPFTADPKDDLEHGRQIHALLLTVKGLRDADNLSRPELDELKLVLIKGVLTWVDDQIDTLVGPYSRTERLSWPQQALEAAPSGPSTLGASLPMVSALAASRGRSVAHTMEKIAAKAAKSRALTVLAIQTREHMQALMDSALVESEVRAVPAQAQAFFADGLAYLLAHQ